MLESCIVVGSSRYFEIEFESEGSSSAVFEVEREGSKAASVCSCVEKFLDSLAPPPEGTSIGEVKVREPHLLVQ